MYMDDFAASNNEESNLITMYGHLTTMMNTIHLPMSKCPMSMYKLDDTAT